jgi:hypothetical protein
MLSALGLVAATSCVTGSDPETKDAEIASALTGTMFNWNNLLSAGQGATLRGVLFWT